MDLHPQLRDLLDELAAADYPDQTTVPPAQARWITDDRARRYYGAPEPVDHTVDRPIPGPEDMLQTRVYWPKGVARARFV